MNAEVEATIQSVRNRVALELQVCPCCSRPAKSIDQLASEIGVERFALRRFVKGANSRADTFMKILRWASRDV